MKIKEDWHQSWRLHSVQVFALIFFLTAAEIAMSWFEAEVPRLVYAISMGLLAVAGVWARNIKQEPTHGRKR
jgi:hypothetical protein